MEETWDHVSVHRQQDKYHLWSNCCMCWIPVTFQCLLFMNIRSCVIKYRLVLRPCFYNFVSVALGLIPLSYSWWRHRMETFSAPLAFCAGNSPVTGASPSRMPVTRSFSVFFDLRLNKRLSKQLRRRGFETPSCSLWRHCDVESIWYILDMNL